MSYIELHDITFSYTPEESPVLEDFNLTVEKGSCIFIKGENGSGKTTLLRILNGLSYPQKGQYIYDDIHITKDYLKNNRQAKAFHKRIGYLFQNPDVMLFNSSVYDEVAFGPRQMGLSDTEVDQRVQDCMRLFSIEDLSGKAPYHLSGGQKKRVSLASIFSLNPELLILDEPLAGLDRKTKNWLLDFLMNFKKCGKTILIVSHDEEFADALADQQILL